MSSGLHTIPALDNGQTYRQTNGRIDRQTENRQTDGQTDKPTDGRTDFVNSVALCMHKACCRETKTDTEMIRFSFIEAKTETDVAKRI